VKAALSVAALLAAALAVAALAVFAAGDGSTLVPPPEAVAENFLRAVSRRRYQQALPYLRPELRAAGVEGLRRYHQRIERACGLLRDVRGEDGVRAGESATATVLLKGAAAQGRMRFALVRERGEWRLATLGEWVGSPAALAP
jgi:hypothetical protein